MFVTLPSFVALVLAAPGTADLAGVDKNDAIATRLDVIDKKLLQLESEPYNLLDESGFKDEEDDEEGATVREKKGGGGKNWKPPAWTHDHTPKRHRHSPSPLRHAKAARRDTHGWMSNGPGGTLMRFNKAGKGTMD